MRAAHIWLIGPSGAGKSTVAPLLAARLGLPAHDSDARVVAEAGRGIGALFAAEGEAGFRIREASVLAALAAGPAAVIAVGGGALEHAGTAALLGPPGRVIRLEASAAVRATRLAGAPAAERPLLADATDLAARLADQARRRDPLYRAVATHAIATDGLDPAAVAALAAAWLAQGPR